MEAITLVLKRALKSTTVWAAGLLVVLSTSQQVLESLLAPLGAFSPEGAAKVAAVVLLITRLRSIVVPVLAALKTDDTDAAGA